MPEFLFPKAMSTAGGMLHRRVDAARKPPASVPKMGPEERCDFAERLTGFRHAVVELVLRVRLLLALA